MAICKSCKLCTKDSNAPVEMVEIVDKSWCPVWEDWQSTAAPQCKHYEAKDRERFNPYFNKDNKSSYKPKNYGYK